MAFVPTGDIDIDRIRREAADAPTDPQSFEERYLILITWRHLLQRQGAYTESAAKYPDRYQELYVSGDKKALFETVDEEFRTLAALQESLAENPPVSVPSGETATDVKGSPVDWPMYGGNPQHTAYTEDRGPVEGKVAWKRPMGLAWYPRPVAEDGKIYVTSPGMRTIAYCLDSASGEVVWKTRRNPTDHGDWITVEPHTTHCAASTPLVLKDAIVINEMGGQARDYAATDLLIVRKSDGELIEKFDAGSLDYRVGHASVTGDEDILVYPAAAQKIEAVPPHTAGVSRIVCKETSGGKTLWDFYVGPIFSEPVLSDGQVFVGTADGVFFCLNAEADRTESRVWGVAPRQRVAWQYKAGGATNSSALVTDERVFFGANDGVVTCLEKETGRPLWKHKIEATESRAFKLFSTPRIEGGRLYIGAADRRVYCLDADTGKRIWDYQTEDWIRSAPIPVGDRVYVALINGTVQCLDQSGGEPKLVWETKPGTHSVLADLVVEGDRVVATSTDLFLWCIDATDGKLLWRHSLLECIYRDGERIAADEVASVAGGHYQSKPTAADGKVFYGTPARFIYAIDHRTGRELWRFEMGAAVSGSPTYSDGRVFVGQQGGEDYFYCLDANDGHMIWRQSLGWVWSSATISDGKLFVPGVDGYVSCLRAEDGAILWRYRTGRAAHPEPPVDRGRVYFGSWDHYDYALDVEDGSVVWQFYTGGSPDSGAPIAYEGRLYLPMGGDSFRCIDAETGEQIWEHRVINLMYNASPALHDGRVFVSTGKYPVMARMYCLDAETGTEIWQHPGGLLTAAAIAGGKVYFGSTADPYFYCVDEKGNGDGTTTCLWKVKMGDRVFESVPPIYVGMAYICCRDGYFYALK